MNYDVCYFRSLDSIVDKHNIWIQSWEYDILLRINKLTFQLENYYCIPTSRLEPFQHIMISDADDKVYILPFNGEELYYLDKKSEIFTAISMPYEENELTVEGKISFSAYWNGRLALFSGTLNKVFYYDEKSGDFVVEKMIEHPEEDNSKMNLLTDFYTQIDRIVYIPLYQTSKILKVDIESMEKEEIDIGRNFRLHTISNYTEDDEIKIMLVTLDDETIIWSPSRGVESVKKSEAKNTNDKYKFACRINGKYYFVPEHDDMIYVVKGEELSRVNYKEKRTDNPHKEVQFGFATIVDMNIVFQERKSGMIYCLNTETDMVSRIETGIGRRKLKEIAYKRCDSEKSIGMINENEFIGIEEFVKSVS